MSNIKFTQLPNLGAPTATTIIPVVDSGVNYTVTGANLQTYVTSTTGNITGGNILTGGVVSAAGNVRGSNLNTTGLVTATGNVTGGNILTDGYVSATGNITGSYFFGNGSQLTGLPATYGNANVADFLPTYSGVVGASSVSATGDIIGGFFVGNGAQVGNLNAANVLGTVANATYATSAGSAGSATTAVSATTAGTVTDNAQANITSVGTLSSLSVTGNISGNYFLGNGSQLTGIATTSYGNANVADYLPTYTGGFTSLTGNVTTTANIQANYFVGNGSQLTGIVATTTYNNSNVAAFLPTYTGAMPSMTGNVATTANIQANYFIGNGSQVTGLVNSIQVGSGLTINQSTGVVTITNANPTPYTNSNVNTLLATWGSNTISTTGTITAGNVTGSNVLTGGAISATGNVTGSYIKGNGSALTGLVTSIIAGTGITVNSATGAVTVTATGSGGSGNIISNGTSNVSIPVANGNITFSTGGTTKFTITNTANPYVNVIANGSIQADSLYANAISMTGFSVNSVGNVSLGNGGSTVAIGGASIIVIMPQADGSGGTGTGWIVPRATAVTTRTYTGVAGSIRAITDSPTNAGRMCYWCTTNSRWQYIDTNAAV
jgi:hypothetical protein